MKMRKIVSSLILATILIVPFSVKAVMSDLSISGDKEVSVGKSIQLKVYYDLSNDLANPDTNKTDNNFNRTDVTSEVNWSIDSDSMSVDGDYPVKIDKNGVVTGLFEGKATLVANYEGMTAIYEVNVKEKNYTKAIIIGTICCLVVLGASSLIFISNKNNKANK